MAKRNEVHTTIKLTDGEIDEICRALHVLSREYKLNGQPVMARGSNTLREKILDVRYSRRK